MSGPVQAALLAQGVPFAASAVILLFLRRHRAAAAWLAILSVAVSVGASIYLVRAIAVPGLSLEASRAWLPISGAPPLSFGTLLDPLSSVMALVVSAVTLLVMVYSLGYMAGDPGHSRYFAWLSLFAAAMLGLVLASNLLQTLVFWELVGLASFLLIGFWFEKKDPGQAARKAFIMTRVGDVGFLFGVLLLLRGVGNVSIPSLLASVPQWSGFFTSVVAALLLMGVAGKSAQGPLFTWLPDAMAGPTPVSALLHSATMVAAGVYLVARLHPLFMAAPDVMNFLLWMSLITAVAAATMAMVATDIKRVLAYSSISQLAYMLMALAAGSVAAGFFHLVTHAGFKALLFLSAGILIHHAHSNDMREIAGHVDRRRWPAMVGLVAGSLALAGVIPFAGYFSKEAVLASLGHWAAPGVKVMAFGGAFLTAYYAARMVFLTLRGDASPHERIDARHPTLAEKAADFMMAVPVLLLSAGTLLLGWIGPWLEGRIRTGSGMEMSLLHFGLEPVIALSLAAIGIGLAWWEYGRRGATRVGFAERVPTLHELFANNWHLDRFYAATFVPAAGLLSRLARWFDRVIFDGAGDSVAVGGRLSGRLLSRVQGGQVQLYVGIVIAVLVLLAFWLNGVDAGS